MTIQPTSSYNPYSAPQHTAQKPAAQSAPQQPQDTVQLSAQAQKSGDVDHDGDSH